MILEHDLGSHTAALHIADAYKIMASLWFCSCFPMTMPHVSPCLQVMNRMDVLSSDLTAEFKARSTSMSSAFPDGALK